MLSLVALVFSTSPAQPRHDRTFWVSIIEHKYQVPAGEDPFTLLTEMNALLGSTDPVLRDDVAYTSAARWILRGRLLTGEQQKALLAEWLKNLTLGLGERGTDTVFRRSFSALNLSILAARDNESPFLSQTEFEDFLARTISYLEQEHDTRGFDAAKGWIHTPAHTADTLKFLARNTKLPAASQAQLLSAVTAKCQAVDHVFTWGEDERLAQVVRSIVRRQDFDGGGFERWLAGLPATHRQLWAKGPAIDPAAFPPVQNVKQLLRAAFVALSSDKDLPVAAERARQQLLTTLAQMG